MRLSASESCDRRRPPNGVNFSTRPSSAAPWAGLAAAVRSPLDRVGGEGPAAGSTEASAPARGRSATGRPRAVRAYRFRRASWPAPADECPAGPDEVGEPGRGTLVVVVHGARRRGAVRVGAVPAHRGHDQPVPEPGGRPGSRARAHSAPARRGCPLPAGAAASGRRAPSLDGPERVGSLRDELSERLLAVAEVVLVERQSGTDLVDDLPIRRVGGKREGTA